MDKLKNWIRENSHRMDVDEPNAAVWNHIKSNLLESVEDDRLKTHIAKHKNKLQVEHPDTQSWEKISRLVGLKKPQYAAQVQKRMIYLSAACIIVIVCLGILRYMNADNKDQNSNVSQKTESNHSSSFDTTHVEINKNKSTLKQPPPESSKAAKGNSVAISTSKLKKQQKVKSLPPELLQIEKDYDELISGQIKYTKSLAIYGESTGYFKQFKNDFKMLERQEKELRLSIVQHGLEENSIDDLAMIYQLKLTVLKKLQNEINKTSSRNMNLSDTVPVYIQL